MKVLTLLVPMLISGLVFAAAEGQAAADAPSTPAASREFRQVVDPKAALKVIIEGERASLTATEELEENILQEIALRFGVTLSVHCEDPRARTERVGAVKSDATLPELVDAATGKTLTFIYRDADGHTVQAPPDGPPTSAFRLKKRSTQGTQKAPEGKIVSVDAFPPGCALTSPVARRFGGEVPASGRAGAARQPMTVAQAAAIMESEGPLSREHALESLRATTDPAAAALARQAINDPNPVVMVDAARLALILGRRFNTLPQAEQALANRFKQAPYLDLVMLLAPRDKSLSWPAISELTRSSDKTANVFAVRALAASLDPRGLPWLKQMAQKGELNEAAQAASVIGKIGGPEAVKALADLLASPGDAQHIAAVEGIALLPEAERTSLYGSVVKMLHQSAAQPKLYEAFVRRNYLKPLGALLADPHADADAKVKALDAMAITGNAETIHSMTPAMTDPRPEVRRAATTAIAQVIVEPGIAPLIAATKDSDAEVRATAAQGLGEFTSDDGIVAALAPLLNDPDARVRKNAIDSLVRLGKPTEAMAAAYKAAQHSSDPYVAKQAADQIRYWRLGGS